MKNIDETLGGLIEAHMPNKQTGLYDVKTFSDKLHEAMLEVIGEDSPKVIRGDETQYYLNRQELREEQLAQLKKLLGK